MPQDDATSRLSCCFRPFLCSSHGQDKASDPETLHDLRNAQSMSALDAARKTLSASTRSTKIEREEFPSQNFVARSKMHDEILRRSARSHCARNRNL